MTFDYAAKFETFKKRTHYERLSDGDRDLIRGLAFKYRFTFQEFRQVAEAARDFSMWGEGDLQGWATANARGSKAHFLRGLRAHVTELKRRPVDYPATSIVPTQREHKRVVTETSDKKVFGMCPVASEKTVCCNLRTIDAVENCVFGCSYCSVQTFYRDDIVFDANLADKLRSISLEPGRFYHIGTGQASDALAWGNRNGILDALCDFAAEHPHILLEFKTKSDNVRYFLEHEAPANVVCSWSLNTPVVIANEEHFTADFERRVTAARLVADRGMRVAFHFHPMVHYQGWDVDYPEAASILMELSPRVSEGLGAVRYVSSATLFFGFKLDQLGERPRGYGFLVPRCERRRINGATWVSNKYPGRAPDDAFLARCYVGGDRTPGQLAADDGALTRACLEELRDIALIDAPPNMTRVFRWNRSNPQYDVGHAECVEKIEGALGEHRGLWLTGSGYRGIGIPDCVRDGRETAKRAFAFMKERAAV